MLYYSIAHYYDVNDRRKNAKYEHIKNHIKTFLDIDEEQKEFILVSFIDTPRGDVRYENIKKHLQEFCKMHLSNNNVHVIIEYNWGGTIAALWLAYLYIKSINCDDTVYVSHFEEDFGPHLGNNNWYIDSQKLLNDDMIYIGESSIGRIKHANRETGQNDDGRIFHIKRGGICLALPEIWTDGGYYFSTINKLKMIEKKIGIFHKGDQNKKYDNLIDGISIGEVGFPTLLHHANFKFTCLDRRTYFLNEWCGGH